MAMKLEGVKGSDLRDMSDKAKGHIGSGIVFLTSVTTDTTSFLIGVTTMKIPFTTFT